MPFKAYPHLVKAVKGITREHPDLDAYPVVIRGGNTEMADALRRHIPAITIAGTTRDGIWPYWHQVADTYDKMDSTAMEKNWEFTQAMLTYLDKE